MTLTLFIPRAPDVGAIRRGFIADVMGRWPAPLDPRKWSLDLDELKAWAAAIPDATALITSEVVDRFPYRQNVRSFVRTAEGWEEASHVG